MKNRLGAAVTSFILLSAVPALARPWLGIGMDSPSDNQTGALVNQVESGSPAEIAGIASGDIIVRIGTCSITDPSDVFKTVGNKTDGEVVDILIVRNGLQRSIRATLKEVPISRVESFSKITLLGIPWGTSVDGVRKAVLPRSAAS